MSNINQMNPTLEQFKKILQIQEERNLYHQKQYELLQVENNKLILHIEKLVNNLNSEKDNLHLLEQNKKM